MKVLIYSFYNEAVLDLVREQFASPSLVKISQHREENNIILEFQDDLEYRDMACWLSHALGCGLITGGNIER